MAKVPRLLMWRVAVAYRLWTGPWQRRRDSGGAFSMLAGCAHGARSGTALVVRGRRLPTLRDQLDDRKIGQFAPEAVERKATPERLLPIIRERQLPLRVRVQPHE